MAVTKIHPIKSTLKKALDYITNPVKTDDKLYVSSFGCAVETADIEFEKTRLRAMNKGNNLAHHLIQAFEPGEVTPEAAHEIGRQLADSILGGKYEYVLTTHIDKGHVHNHLIFCSVDFAEHIETYRELRPLYDEYRKSRDKEKYLRGHESEIILFEAAAKALKAAGVSGKLPDSAKLKADYQRLAAEKDRLYSEYGKLKKQLREYDAVKQNIDSILSPVQQREQEKML